MEYRVNPALDVPIYTQLVDMLSADIMNGRLPCGTKLPTVREFSDSCGIAPGTVMRAYNELEQRGVLEKIQGRGTFVSYREDTGVSRKDSAMTAIDSMLDTLDALNFSRTETEIFINLKLRERYSERGDVSAAVVECSYETLYSMAAQLRTLPGVDVYTYQLDDVLAYPYKISNDTDIIVVSASHAEKLAAVLPDSGKLAKAAMHLTAAALSEIARIPAHSSIGILCQSVRFGEIAGKACTDFAPDAVLCAAETFSSDIRQYLEGKDRLIVPGSYERFCSADAAAAISAFGEDKLIRCDYCIDDGSFMYLTDRINRIREQK